MRSSVVIVNWNAGDALRACVASLADDARAGCEVVVVDNASERRQRGGRRRGVPVAARRGGRRSNLGFAAGANLGAARVTRRRRRVPESGRARPAGRARGAGGRARGDAARRHRGRRAARRPTAAGSPARHGFVAARAPAARHDARAGCRRAGGSARTSSTGSTAPSWRCARDLFRQLGGFDADVLPLRRGHGPLPSRAGSSARARCTCRRARAVHGANVSAAQRFGLGPRGGGGEGRAALLRAPRPRPATLRLFRAARRSCKFGAKARARRACSGGAATAATYGRVVRACLERDGVSARRSSRSPCRAAPTSRRSGARSTRRGRAGSAGPARRDALELVVCLNGEPGDGRGAARPRSASPPRATTCTRSLIDADADAGAARRVGDRPRPRRRRCARARAGKAIAWNLLRARGPARPRSLFMDADVVARAPAIGLLLDALDARARRGAGVGADDLRAAADAGSSA